MYRHHSIILLGIGTLYSLRNSIYNIQKEYMEIQCYL